MTPEQQNTERDMACALSYAITAAAMPMMSEDDNDIQTSAANLIHLLQEMQDKTIMTEKDITAIATSALKGIDRTRSKLNTLGTTVPVELITNYGNKLNTARKRFMLYAQPSPQRYYH